MFKCDNFRGCGRTTEAGEPMTKVVFGTRRKDYYTPSGALIGQGTEILSEVGLCIKCAEKHGETSPRKTRVSHKKLYTMWDSGKLVYSTLLERSKKRERRI